MFHGKSEHCPPLPGLRQNITVPFGFIRCVIIVGILADHFKYSHNFLDRLKLLICNTTFILFFILIWNYHFRGEFTHDRKNTWETQNYCSGVFYLWHLAFYVCINSSVQPIEQKLIKETINPWFILFSVIL